MASISLDSISLDADSPSIPHSAPKTNPTVSGSHPAEAVKVKIVCCTPREVYTRKLKIVSQNPKVCQTLAAAVNKWNGMCWNAYDNDDVIVNNLPEKMEVNAAQLVLGMSESNFHTKIPTDDDEIKQVEHWVLNPTKRINFVYKDDINVMITFVVHGMDAVLRYIQTGFTDLPWEWRRPMRWMFPDYEFTYKPNLLKEKDEWVEVVDMGPTFAVFTYRTKSKHGSPRQLTKPELEAMVKQNVSTLRPVESAVVQANIIAVLAESKKVVLGKGMEEFFRPPLIEMVTQIV